MGLNIKRFQKRPLPVLAIQVTTANAADVVSWVKRYGGFAQVNSGRGGGIHLDALLFWDRYAAPTDFVVKNGPNFEVWSSDSFDKAHEFVADIEDTDEQQLTLF